MNRRQLPPGCRAVGGVVLAICLCGCQQAQLACKDHLQKLDSSFQRVARVFRSSDPASQTQEPDAPMIAARSLERQGRLDSAIARYNQILQKDPYCAEAYHRLAVLHDKNGDCQAAGRFYQAAIQQNPDDPELYCDLGYSYYLQQRWGEAEAALQRALSLKPDLARAHNNLGLVMARTGRENRALEEFSLAGCSKPEATANLSFAMMWDSPPSGLSDDAQVAQVAHDQGRL